MGMTIETRPVIRSRVEAGGEWHSSFQAFVDYMTQTAVWNSTSTNGVLLAKWAANAGFVYQMFAQGPPAGITFPAHADTRAEWAAKGVEFLVRVNNLSQSYLSAESVREHCFAYDWLHPELTTAQKQAIIGAWKAWAPTSPRIPPGEAGYPTYSGFNYADSAYAANYGYWVLMGLAALGDGIEDAWLQTGVDRYGFAFRNASPGAQAQITKESERAGLDGGFAQGFNYSNYLGPRLIPVEFAYRTALGIAGQEHYGNPSTAGWLRGWLPYLVRMIRPWARASASQSDGRVWLLAVEPGGQAELGPQQSGALLWPAALARKEFPGVDQDTADLAVWFMNRRTFEPTSPVEWVFTRFLGPKGTEKSPAELDMSPDKAFASGKWQWRTGWESISDALIQVIAFRFGALNGAGQFTIDYGGPALPLGPARNHDFDNSPTMFSGNTFGFVDATRTELETDNFEGDDYGFQRLIHSTSARLALTPQSTADYLDPATVKFRTTTMGGEGVGYLSLDLERSYNSDAVNDGRSAVKVSSYHRNFIYFPPSTPGTDSLRLFLFDFATSKSTTFEKRQTFVSYADPVIDGTPHANQPVRAGSGDRKTRYSGATVISSAQSGPNSGSTRLFITPLSPAGFDVVKVQYRYTATDESRRIETPYGFPSPPDAWGGSSLGDFQNYNAFWRVEVIPTVRQLTDYFCTALEAWPSESATRTLTERVAGTNFVGGRIGDAVGVHAVPDSSTGGTFILPSPGTYRLFVAGLGASVTRSLSGGANINALTSAGGGLSCSEGCQVTPQGTLYLTVVVSSAGNGPANTITVGPAVGGPTAPSPPGGVRIVSGH